MKFMLLYFFFLFSSTMGMFQQKYIEVKNETSDLTVEIKGWYRDHGFTNTPQVSCKDVLPKQQEVVLVEKTSKGFFSLLMVIKKLDDQKVSQRLQLNDEQTVLTIRRKPSGVHIEDKGGMICILEKKS